MQAIGIGVLLAATTGLFLYTGGFLTSARLSGARMTDQIETSGGGAHAGFRRAHAKGICIAGSFVGTAAGRALSKAAVFQGSIVPVTGRFAVGSPDPYAKDPDVGVRSMALRLQPAGAQEWRMAINDTPGLAVSTPQAFYENAVASAPDPATGKLDPKKVAAFLAKHPETVAFKARMMAKPMASGFANDSYNSINGFIFVAPDGKRRLVRWSMQALDPFAVLSPAMRKGRSANYMFDDLLARVAKGPIRWRLIATIAEPGDPNRAAEVWPDDRKTVDMGMLTIDHVEAETKGNCQDVNFDPLILPAGIEPSDDPIPFARSAVYAESFRRRAGEHKRPGALSNQSAGAAR
ncbi:catalase family peroxidase [Sphingobium sp. Z007]|uniref:catalase family peroxidase n=1 Tax=Sphingobium sp. Z007 TaxID=627495 RepID=UPI000B4A3383|nr:catalase family peroxidase [Sphingobium sp. Z007]